MVLCSYRSLDSHSQERVYLLCFLQGGIVFRPPVNDVFSRFIRYGPLSPFSRLPRRFPGILARDEGWIVRCQGSACWWLSGLLRKRTCRYPRGSGWRCQQVL